MNRFLRAGLFALAISTIACAQPLGPDSPPSEVAVERLRVEAHPFEQHSGFDEAERRVIRNQNAWVAVWEQIYEGRSPKPPLPVIDFSKETVVVAALGTRPTSGFDVLVTGASRTPGIVTVRLETTSPGSGCTGTASLTQPVDVATLVLRPLELVRFEETAEVHNCR